MTDIDAETIKRQRLAVLLAEHRATLNEVIRIADRHTQRSGHAIILWELARNARLALSAIAKTEADPHLTGTHGSLGEWGQNGRGPRITGMLRSARFHDRELSAARAVAA